MFSHKFKACMWKNYRARRLSLFLTFLEITFPALLFGVLTFIHIKNSKEDQKYAEFQYLGEPYSEERLAHEAFDSVEHIDILFSPPTNSTVKLMEFLFINVFIKHNVVHKIRNFDGMANDLLVASWLASKYFKEDTSSKAKAVGFGFIFNEKPENQTDYVEDHLSYRLMCTLSTISTGKLYPDYINQQKRVKESAGAGESKPYISSGVAILQWNLEKAIIELLYGEKVPFELELHSFPCPSAVKYQRDERFFITILLPLFTMISFIFFIPVVIRRVVQEKATGVKELMRIMGLNSWYLWSGWLIHSVMIFLVTTAIVTVILCVPFDNEPAFLDFIDPTILWLLLLLFCTASVIFCFTVTTFFNNPVGAMSCGVILWIGTFTILNPLVEAEHLPLALRVLICLFPTAAVTTGYNIIGVYDNRNDRLTWSRIFEQSPLPSVNMNMAMVFGMLLIDVVVFSLITWYFDCVKPGRFGIAKPWNFLFQSLKPTTLLTAALAKKDIGTYEEPQPYLKAGIIVDNIRKVYTTEAIGLDGVTMTIYQGVITVLLGHNGAGKTSLMGIISGLHSPTSGRVFVGGEDIFSNMKQFHQNVGICFQHNYLCDFLTVIEHFIFFGMLKGMSFKKAKREGLILLRDTNMLDKKYCFINTLSGGMLRRLCLSIALIGNPKVLLLDEPTSGMDPEGRREVWDIILKKRGNHTILITTQFMEEADVLGDWIAIMDHGKVVCYGTTPFLKSLYGTGYHVTIAKDKRFDSADITKVVTSYVPQCSVVVDMPTQLNFNLPQESTDKFPDMFAQLEDRQYEFGITGMGVQCTTIEEVFLKVGEMLQGSNSKTFKNYLLSNLPKNIGAKDSLSGSKLFFQQFRALLVKKLIFDLRNIMLLLIMTIIPVVIVTISFPQSLNIKNLKAQPPLKIELKIYGNTTVFSSVEPKKGYEEQYKILNQSYDTVAKYEGAKVFNTNNVTAALLNYGTKKAQMFRLHTIVSVEFIEYLIRAFFSSIPIHSIPISINMVSNALLKYYFPKSDLKITFTYMPVDVSAVEDTCAQASLNLGENIGHQWAISMPQCLLCIMTVFIMLPAVERSTSCKHLQLMTGVTPLLYWLSCFLWDYFIYGIVVLLLIITIIIFDEHHIFSTPYCIGLLVLILMLYGLSGTFYAYFCSNFGSSTSKIVGNYLVFSICFGMVTAICMNVALKSKYSGETLIPPDLLLVLQYSLPICPHYCLVMAVIMYGSGIYQNYLCANCPEHICDEEPLLVFNCKEHQYGFLLELIYLSLDWILYLALVLMADNKIFHNFYWKLRDYTMDTTFEEDGLIQTSDVKREKEKTLACSKIRSVDPKAVFLCVGLGKVYSKKSLILQPMNFRVRKGECFGLLGTNGAGKSTTFKLLVGEVRPTAGDAINYNHTLRRNRRMYLKNIGYCPQLGALNYSFTGEETLRLIAQLRGIHPLRVETEVDNWIRLLGLTEHRSMLCGTYSTGTMRKLSTAVALIGRPQAVFLDEPTAGVDPFGRRNLWAVLNASRDLGQAVLLTSHSMEECEALCARLTIMVNGRMVCLGNTQYLKNKFGQGFTVAFVLHTTSELQDTIPNLKAEVYKNLTRVKLKDEHKKLLHFHVKDENIKLSQLFNVMEKLKKSYAVIESYTLGNTTLEQVFISFAKSHIKPEIII